MGFSIAHQCPPANDFVCVDMAGSHTWKGSIPTQALASFTRMSWNILNVYVLRLQGRVPPISDTHESNLLKSAGAVRDVQFCCVEALKALANCSLAATLRKSWLRKQVVKWWLSLKICLSSCLQRSSKDLVTDLIYIYIYIYIYKWRFSTRNSARHSKLVTHSGGTLFNFLQKIFVRIFVRS